MFFTTHFYDFEVIKYSCKGLRIGSADNGSADAWRQLALLLLG